MSNAYFKVPVPINEPVLTYAPGTPERDAIKKKLQELQSKEIEIPLIIGGKEIKTGKTAEIRVPHNHSKKLGIYHKAGAKEVNMAIEAAIKGKKRMGGNALGTQGFHILKGSRTSFRNMAFYNKCGYDAGTVKNSLPG